MCRRLRGVLRMLPWAEAKAEGNVGAVIGGFCEIKRFKIAAT